MAEVSSVSEQLLILDGLEDFRQHARQMGIQARRQLRLLSEHLDFPVFDQQPFADAISTLARRGQYSDIRIIVKDTQPLIEQGHKLAKLASRLPSKVRIKKLGIEPTNKEMTFLLVDNNKVLFRPDERVYKGFANYDGGPEVKNLDETFARLWQYSEDDPQLRRLYL